MNNNENIGEEIEANMRRIDAYEGIKRPNSYFMLAEILEWYAKRCIERGRAESDKFYYEVSRGE